MSNTAGTARRVANTVRKTISQANKSLVRGALEPKTFRYIDQLTNYLRQHFILHEPGRFLIIPKPYGISCLGQKTEHGGIFPNSVHNKKEKAEEKFQTPSSSRSDVVLEDCIPALAKAFGEPKLHFYTGLKRYLSGAIVLPARTEEANNIKNSMKYAAYSETDYHYRCLAILLGHLPNSKGTVTGYSTFYKVGNRSEYIFVPGNAKKRAKAGKFAVEGTVEYNVLDKKYGCSLVEFRVNKFARHLPRLAFSHLSCPILGDPLYMARLISQDGKPVLINPGQKLNKDIKQWFPKQLEERLGTSSAELTNFMPLYCHVYRTLFPSFGWAQSKAKREQDTMDLLACAPPPSHFLAMTEALEMNGALIKFLQEEETGEEAPVHGDTKFI